MSSNSREPEFDVRNQPLTRRQVLKGALVVGAGAALGPALAACGGGGTSGSASPSPSPSSAGPKKGGSLKVGITPSSGADNLDAQSSSYEPEDVNNRQMFNRLVEYTPAYQLENVLAEQVTPNADGSVWTVKLRQGVVFHDGKPLTADDVVFSYNRIINPKAPKDGATILADLKPSGIKKLDNQTVQFTLQRPNAIFPEAMAYRENSIVPVGFDEMLKANKPVGTGPFKLKSHVPTQQPVLLPNEHYFGQVPYVDDLTIIQFADPAARVNALLSGVVDHVDQVGSAQVPTVKAQSGCDVWLTKSGVFFPFTMRIDQKPFNDVRVRQAFRFIVDRKAMIQQAFDDYG